jgi:pyrroline-5-carboxylate reductase
MGGALLEGWIAAGLPPARVAVIEPRPTAALQAFAARHAIALNPPAPAPCDVLVLVIKPQTLEEAGPGLAPLVGPATLIVSVLAGKTIADLAARIPGAGSIVRTIPNTPAAVGRGITCAVAGPGVSSERRALADRLLSAVGRVVWVEDEDLIDAATAVSGSGPAYVFHLVECLAEAGEAIGLPAEVALALARSTVEGAGELMFREPMVSAADLRRNVTSPNGTTAAALAVLMREDGLAPLLREAVRAARDRARALSG